MLALTAMLLLASPEPAAEPVLMTRVAMRAERARLLDERPSAVVPTLGLVLGGLAGIGLPLAFVAGASSYFGIATYMAAILLTGGGVGLVVGVLSALCLVATAPKRRTIDDRVEALDHDWRAGRCRTEAGGPPCRDMQDLPRPAPAAPSVPLFIAPF